MNASQPVSLVSILQGLHDIIFGGAPTSTVTGEIHATAVSVAQSAPFYLINAFAKYAVFAFLFSIAMVIVVVLYSIRFNRLRERVIATILPTDGEKESETGGAEATNPKWTIVEDHINSADPAKWKLAIIEADIILAELLDTLHLPGETVGDKLKAVEVGDFPSIEKAWEAHKIRNAVAHEGSDFLISEREAKRVIGLYRTVFEDFDMV
ncbi:MAG: hypothetical protein KGH93_00200 [Patescibacteria group bacterium]|nr:hypothetical protein [Patescibacteria group bacterium]MDE1945614.1 hypothetical protein [Patescibacteria group bacterium]